MTLTDHGRPDNGHSGIPATVLEHCGTDTTCDFCGAPVCEDGCHTPAVACLEASEVWHCEDCARDCRVCTAEARVEAGADL